MLFNNPVSQSGGTHSIISVIIPPNGSKSYEIPDEATMFCFCGSCNGSCGYIATRGADKNFHVEVNVMSYNSSAAIEGNRVTIKSTTDASYASITGTLIYK